MRPSHRTLCCLALIFGSIQTSLAQGVPPRVPSLPPRVDDVVTAPRPTFAPTAAAQPLVASAPRATKTLPEPSTLPRVERKSVFHDVDAAAALWSRAGSYKLRSDAGGTDFIPFFGSQAPHNFPVHFALKGASVGGEPLALDGGAKPGRSGDTVRFDRGAIDEVYEIGLDQLEQEFVVKSLPANGELALTIAVDTELARSVVDDGFEFGNDYGRVHCGTATAIDASGRKRELASELSGGAITIRVPADFVAGAALPLVIDPLWFIVDLETYPSVLSFAPDTAHPSGPYLFVCWEELFSQNDHDVLTELITGGGAVYSYAYVDYTSENWVRPRAGHITAGDCVLVAAEVGQPGTRAVFGRTIQVGQPLQPVLSQKFEISNPLATGEKFHPEVGGDPFATAPSYFCVVFERAFASNDHDIHAQLVDGSGALAGGTIYLENSFNTLDTDPAISRTDDAWIWNIVWQHETSPGVHRIDGARTFWNGNAATGTFTLSNTPNDCSHPTAAGRIEGSDRYMVAWSQWRPFDYQVVASLVDGTTALSSQFLAGDSSDELEPMIETNGRHFMCSYNGDPQFNGSRAVYAIELDPVGDTFASAEELVVATQQGPYVLPRVVCHHDSDPASLTTLYFVIWGRNGDILMAADFGTEGGSIQSFCDQPLLCPCGYASGSGGGCPNSSHASGARLTGSGTASTLADTMTCQFTDLPPNVSCLMFQGPSSNAFTFGDGIRCIGTPTIRFPLRAANGSGATGYGAAYGDTPISVRGGVPALGGTYCYQVWYRDPASFCTPATTNVSNALRVLWTP
jgi:hypothetical protein